MPITDQLIPFGTGVNAPTGGTFQPPVVDFSPLGNLGKAYFEGQQQRRASDIADAFKGGVPTTPDGRVDINAIINKSIQLGGLPAVQQVLGPLIQQQNAQQASSDLERLLGAGGGTSTVPPISSGTGTTAAPVRQPGDVSTGMTGTGGSQRSPVAPRGSYPEEQGRGEGNGTVQQPFKPQTMADYNALENGTYYSVGGGPAVLKGSRDERPPQLPTASPAPAQQPSVVRAPLPPIGGGGGGPAVAPTQVPGSGPIIPPIAQAQSPQQPPQAGQPLSSNVPTEVLYRKTIEDLQTRANAARVIAQRDPNRAEGALKAAEALEARAKQLQDVLLAGPKAGAEATAKLPSEVELARRKAEAEREEANKRQTPEQKLYEQAVQQGYKGTIDQFQAALAGSKKSQEEIGGAQGKVIAEAIEGQKPARERIQLLDTLADAYRRGSGKMTTGPFADEVLKAKQAIGSLFNADVSGTVESEIIQKVNQQLATQAVRAISSRPTQLEFQQAMRNNPGLLMSPTGAKYMIAILKQVAQQDADLARLAQNPANHARWGEVVDDYYNKHPIKPLSETDIKQLGVTSRAAGTGPAASGGRPMLIDQKTGLPSHILSPDGKTWVPMRSM